MRMRPLALITVLQWTGGDVVWADAPQSVIFVGPGEGQVVDCRPYSLMVDRPLPMAPFDPSFRGGVTVAAGDVTGDGRPELVVGARAGGGPQVKVFDGSTPSELASFFAFDPAFRGGVRVATGDLNGDGAADIIAGAGPGGGPHVKVFNGKTRAELASFFAYDPTFAGGVFVAAGDMNGDGVDDIITGAGAGAEPHVKVFDGVSQEPLASFFPYGASFAGGVRVASGDLDGDGTAEIAVAPGPNSLGLPVRVLEGSKGGRLWEFTPPSSASDAGLAIGDSDGDQRPELLCAQTGKVYRLRGDDGAPLDILSVGVSAAASGGISVAVGDVNGDGRADIMTGHPDRPLVTRLTPDFASRFVKQPLGQNFRGGFSVACGDLDGDGVFDMVMGAGAGGLGNVKSCTGTDGRLLDNLNLLAPPTSAAVMVAAGDVNGDGRDEIVVGNGQGLPPQVRVFRSGSLEPVHSFVAYGTAFMGGVRVATGDVNGDGVDDIITGTGPGAASQVKVFDGGSLAVLRDLAPESPTFTGGVYVAAGDLNGDGVADIVTGTGSGPPIVRFFDGRSIKLIGEITPFESSFQGGVRVAVGDLDGDGSNEILCASGPGRTAEVRGFAIHASAHPVFHTLPFGPSFSGGLFIASFTPAPAAVSSFNFHRLPDTSLAITWQVPRGRTFYIDSTANGVVWQEELRRPGTGSLETLLLRGANPTEFLFRGRAQ